MNPEIIVIDTNVLISAVLTPEGIARKTRRWRQFSYIF